MDNYSGILTKDGRKVLSSEFIEKLRLQEERKNNSNIFVAQKGPQEEALADSVDILITGGNRGGGKANTYATPVITPDGRKRMGDLVVGDKICTPWDGVQTVEAIYEQGEKKVYEVTFDDGTHVRVMDSHRFWCRFNHDDKYDVHELKEFLNRYDVNALHSWNLVKKGYSEVEIPLCGEVEMHEEVSPLSLPLHPRMLGAALTLGRVSPTTHGLRMPDVLAVKMMAIKLGFNIRKRKTNGEAFRYLTPFTDETREALGIKQTNSYLAHIPDKYMTASRQSRLCFLQGFFSACGVWREKAYVRGNNRKLFEQVEDMARSMGMKAWIEETDDMQTKLSARVNIKDYKYVIFIEGGLLHEIGRFCAKFVAIRNESVKEHSYPRFEHKNWIPATDPQAYGACFKRVVRIRKIQTAEPCRCITVSGKHHLYLTDAYTVNHNTFTLLMGAIKDAVECPRFSGILFRKEKDDFNNIVRDSRMLYGDFGHYNKSSDDMTWYFNGGGEMKFTYYDQPFSDFEDRFRGQQYAYIGIDEITQMSYNKFKFLMTCNRNGAGLQSHIVGTCNPDPLSWVRKVIDWWIGEDGIPIPERDGVVRYCYMGSDSVDNIVWGENRHEVYLQCKDQIDKHWQPEFEEMGMTPETTFVKSITFIRAELKYNKKLLTSDPGYLAGLAQQSEEAQERDLGGNWNFMAMGDDMLSMYHMEQLYQNSQQIGDGIKRASCDVAFTGGDSCVLWLWIGYHIQDVAVFKLDSISTISAVHAKLIEWGVTEDHFTYDLNGLGQSFKGAFKKAIPFNNLEAVDKQFKNIYDNVKSQCAYLFAIKVQNGEISINPDILKRKYDGKGFSHRPLRDILMHERKCIRQDDSKADKGWCIISKEQMKKLVGHSPDFFEALFMRMIFDTKHRKVTIPSWCKRF